MDIVVKGRKAEVPERFRKHVTEKLAKVNRFDGKVMRLDVEVSKERNPRQADRSDRVEITMRSRGPVIRAEAAATDLYAALDVAVGRLDAQMRKVSSQRKLHRRGGSKNPVSVAEATANLTDTELPQPAAEPEPGVLPPTPGPLEVDGEGPLVVREKTHSAAPMTLGQALYEMELVGHDFYLFIDKESSLPSVVYRRRGYDYGVIHLEPGDGLGDDVAELGGAIGVAE